MRICTFRHPYFLHCRAIAFRNRQCVFKCRERSAPRITIIIVVAVCTTDIKHLTRLWQVGLVCSEVWHAAEIAVVAHNVGLEIRVCTFIYYMVSGCCRTCQRTERGVAAEVSVEAEGCAPAVGRVGKVLCAGLSCCFYCQSIA